MDDLGIYELIISQELTWEGLLRDIVKKENINPWEIDVSFLSSKYLEAVSQLKNIDFRLSGKFLLAASILLKMKSDNFEFKDITFSQEYFEDFFEDLNIENLSEEMRNQALRQKFTESKTNINPNLPRSRVKPISLDELVEALKEAMVVKERRNSRREELKERMQFKATEPIDITGKIKTIYSQISEFFSSKKKEEILFSELLPSRERNDIIWTFVPLLHITNEGKIKMSQKEQFGEITITRPIKA
ncbi:MAG: ScpA family protein [Candidatus Nanoarchaeia archaeon]|nr:ScpA family protein [Candidatus Nanoarchaeia archaeon]MDD5053888.1 ScpA family protein [Candidatus Nanoarchaeia archaeon]MDD5499992.1 ScpA family protein [Candidatus Nanoarchaeia archaeon]